MGLDGIWAGVGIEHLMVLKIVFMTFPRIGEGGGRFLPRYLGPFFLHVNGYIFTFK